MTFVELPLITSEGNTVRVWMNWDHVVAVIDQDDKAWFSTTNSTIPTAVDLDIRAIDLIEVVTRYPKLRFLSLNEIQWRLKN
jgi:hypothetical protein